MPREGLASTNVAESRPRARGFGVAAGDNTNKRELGRLTNARSTRAGGPAEAERRGRGYLVDPASSDMLVSKIKPCRCKYEFS